MNEQTEQLMTEIKARYGLDNYTLHTYSFFKDETIFRKPTYLLSMEWFPNETDAQVSSLNPDGTLHIDVDFQTKMLVQLTFKNARSYSTATFPPAAEGDAMEWIEEETELVHGQQFRITNMENNELNAEAAVDNIPVFQPGVIYIQWNQEGQLVHFSISGYFPQQKEVEWEPYGITSDRIADAAASACSRLDVPLMDEEKWLSIYAILPAFLTNDGKSVRSMDDLSKPASFVRKDTVLEWGKPLNGSFEEGQIDLSTEVTEEEVIANERPAANADLNKAEMEKAEKEAERFCALVFPNESGKWLLTGIWTENGYIMLELKPNETDHSVIQRKVKLMVDRDTFITVSYTDTANILQQMQHFASAEPIIVSAQEAYGKLRDYITDEPIYVMEDSQNRYRLYGKINCAYGVDATSGEVIPLD